MEALTHPARPQLCARSWAGAGGTVAREMDVVPVLIGVGGGEAVLILTSNGFWATRSTADHGCPRVPEPGLGTELSLLGDSPPGVPVGP